MSSLRGPDRDRSHIDAAVQLVRQQGLVHGEMPLEGSLQPGGSTGVVVVVTSGDDRRWAVKQVPGSRPSLLPAEAEGLRALAASGTVAVPLVRARTTQRGSPCDRACLVLRVRASALP